LNTLLYDLPAYATSNAGATDYTVRELSAYIKGQLGKFDYRLVVADPYTMATSDPKFNVATFSKNSPGKDFQAISGMLLIKKIFQLLLIPELMWEKRMC
jgi:hypothetical protein